MSNSLVQLFKRFGKTFEEGDTIFLENERGKDMFLILSGKVQISKRVEVRKKVGSTWVREGTDDRVLAVLSAGDFFGEMSLLNEKPRSARADALTQTKAIVLNRNNFERILETQPKLTIKMLKAMSNRVRELDKLAGWQPQATAAVSKAVPSLEKKEEPEEPSSKTTPQKEPSSSTIASAFSPTEHVDAFLSSAIPPFLMLDGFDLQIFEVLKDGEKNLETIANTLKIKDTKKLDALLHLLAALGLLMTFDGEYSNLPLTTRAFTKDGNAFLGNTLQLFQTIFRKGVLLENEILLGKRSDVLSKEEQKSFLRSFFENALIQYGEAVDFLFAHRKRDVRKFIEVAPATGSYAAEVHRNCGSAEGILLEDPEHVKEVEAFLEVLDIQFLMNVQAANAFEALFPQNQELIVLSMQGALYGDKMFELMEKGAVSLTSGGTMLIHDYFLSKEKTAPLQALNIQWILTLLANTPLFLSTEEVKERGKQLQLTIVEEQQLPDFTTAILFRK